MYLERLFGNVDEQLEEESEEEEERQQAVDGRVEVRPTCRVVPMRPSPPSPAATVQLRTANGHVETFEASESRARQSIQVTGALLRDVQEQILLQRGPVVAILMSRRFRDYIETARSSLDNDRGTN